MKSYFLGKVFFLFFLYIRFISNPFARVTRATCYLYYARFHLEGEYDLWHARKKKKKKMKYSFFFSLFFSLRKTMSLLPAEFIFIPRTRLLRHVRFAWRRIHHVSIRPERNRRPQQDTRNKMEKSLRYIIVHDGLGQVGFIK